MPRSAAAGCMGALAMLCSAAAIQASAPEQLLAIWQAEAANGFSAQAGEQLWYREVNGRSCPSCHMESVHVQGRHQRTGKVIEPMAPSTNPERLTDRRKINKWLKRNCKWTFGRECTAQEKGDVVTWLLQQ